MRQEGDGEGSYWKVGQEVQLKRIFGSLFPQFDGSNNSHGDKPGIVETVSDREESPEDKVGAWSVISKEMQCREATEAFEDKALCLAMDLDSWVWNPLKNCGSFPQQKEEDKLRY